MPFRAGRVLRLALACLLAAVPCARAALPLEVYGRLPRLENLALSPDGTRIAFVKTEGNDRVVAVPILLIHGKDDTVVPFEQSKVMYEALQSAKKDVQLVTLKEEDHWLSRGATRLQMLERSVAFLRAHNPPDAAAH